MDPWAPPTNHLYPGHHPPPSSAPATAYPLTFPPSHPPNPSPFPPFQPPIHTFHTPSSNAGFPHPIHHYYPSDDYARRLRNEVIFLHALWLQGPPKSNPNPNPDPIPNFASHLKPSPSTAFKKKNKNPIFRAVPDNPWPVPPSPPAPAQSESGWPEFRPLPTHSIAVASEEDRVRASAIRAQQRGLDSFRSFFAGRHGPESESESDDDPDQDDAFNFDDQFSEVFEGDEDLKGCYQKNWGNGEFICLVCGGSGQKKVGRKYKNCVALVQHTLTVSNTKKRAAHRAYGRVICKALQWDINQLPLVSRNLSHHQGNDMSSAEACKDDYVGVETNVPSLVDENARSDSDPSKATSDVGGDNGTEKKETTHIPLVLEHNPGDQQGLLRINDASNADTSTNHSDSTPNSNLYSVDDPAANLHIHLKPFPSTHFKKKGKKPRPWPVPAPPVSESGWPEFQLRLMAPAPILSEEEMARVSSARVQQKGLDSFRSLLARKYGSELESESDNDQDQDDCSDDDCGFDQFLEVFEGDEELKGYYLKNWGNGDFTCLVCGGSGEKVGKKYKNCVALVHHTKMFSKTNRRAHRAYGQVICKVLGWNFDQLSMVSRNLSLHQGNGMSSAEACKDDPVGVEPKIASIVSRNEESDPLKANSDVGIDNQQVLLGNGTRL